MLKVIFVDDEEIMGEMLEKLISWEQMDIELCGIAYNGLDALVLVEKTNPDIILLDVKMPGMDGLSFMEELRRRGSNAQVIIISAHGEFSYAQVAIAYGAKGYLLKPIDERKLLEIIYEVRRSIIDERNQWVENEQNRKRVNEIIKIEHSRTLSEIIEDGILEDSKIIDKLKNISVNLFIKNFTVISILIQTVDSNTAEEAHIYRTDIETTTIIENSIKASGFNGIIFKRNRNKIMGLIHWEKDEMYQIIKQRLDKVSREIVNQTKLLKRQKATIGYSRIYKDVVCLKSACSEAEEVLINCFYEGFSKVFYYEEKNDIKVFNDTVQTDNEKILLEYVRNGALEKIEEYFNSLFQVFSNNRTAKRYVQQQCFELLISIKKDFQQPNENKGVRIRLDLLTVYDFEEIQTIEDLKQFVMEIITEAVQCHVTRDEDRIRKYCIGKIKRFLEANYTERITLEAISEHVNMSKNYVCKLFRLEEGENIWDYLTGTRIEKARQLLNSTDMKVYEIALSVGYESAFYFSKIFKKHMHVTPAEYRNLKNHK